MLGLFALPFSSALAVAPATGPSTAPAAIGSPDGAATLAPLIHPALILLLCAVAGVATVLLLPTRREITVRKVGGGVLAIAAIIFFALIFRAAAGAPTSDNVTYYFWPFAIIALVGAIRVVTHPRPVYSALYFVLTTFATAGLYVLLWAEFMAAALILIYAGAILVTYVFVIMLAQQATSSHGKAATAVYEYDEVSREPVVAAAVGFGLMAMLLFVILGKAPQTPIERVREVSDKTYALIEQGEATQSIGRHLFENQMLNLELAGLLLTLATVGAIIIARRRIAGMTINTAPEVMSGPATPVDDNPHSIPVYGTENPAQKAYPET